MATLLIEAYVEALQMGTEANIEFKQEVIDQIQLNLPPGILTQTAQKSGLMTFDQIENFDEVKILESVNARLAPKFRELIYLQDEQMEQWIHLTRLSVFQIIIKSISKINMFLW